MNARLEKTAALTDAVKWVAAVAVLTAALAAFYVFAEESLLLRIVGLLAAVGIAGAVAWTTAKGREVWSFLGDARTEVRKVVWPTRTETLQTTGIVVVVVSLLAVVMWGFDSVLSVAVRVVLGTG